MSRRDDIERYVERYPDASRAQIIGALDLQPTDQDLIDDVLAGEDTDDTADFAIDSRPTSPEPGPDALDVDDDLGGPLPAPSAPTVDEQEEDVVDEDLHPTDAFPTRLCEPPEREYERFDRDEQWAAFQDERFDDWVDHRGAEIWGDHAGAGKTTNAAIAAADRDRPHVVLFNQHRKAREFQTDDATPNGYVHLKGAEQKREPACMDADHAGERCPDHGHNSRCPHMCPIYDLPTDHPTRKQYDALVDEVGPIQAHIILDPHDGDECEWQRQYEGLAGAERILGVHQYGTLESIQHYKPGQAVQERDVIFDEGVSLLKRDRELDVTGLVRAANVLEDIGDLQVIPDERRHNARAFAQFARDLVDMMTGGHAPTDVRYPRVEPTGLVERRGNNLQYEIEHESIAEALAQLKVAFNRVILGRMRDDEWEGTPLCLDVLFTLAANDLAGDPLDDPTYGVDHEAAMRAVAVPAFLDRCPWCSSEIEHDEDRHAMVCTDDECGWDDRDRFITQPGGETARALAWWNPTGGAAIQYQQLPNPSQLSDRALYLDATPVPETVAGLTGQRVDDVRVTGTEAYTANMHVTQVTDGQYHASTIETSDAARDRINTTIQKACSIHEKVLVVGKKSIKHLLDLPENTEWLHYHAARGLNRDECDAVICVGAPHPDMTDLERDARLLAMGRDDLNVGGDEHSTRRDEDGHLAANPPIYRPLYYEDDDGDGRAVATKHYTGLVGKLFRAAREDELVQAIHRIRPLLATDEKHVYLLTNVPTEIPVDQVCAFDDLVDPLRAILPVPDGAVDLLELTHDVLEGEGPDGVRASQLVTEVDGQVVNNKREFHRLARLDGMAVSYRTVCNWVNALEAVGLLDAGEYEHRAGVRFSVSTATLKALLSSLHGNDGFKVAVVQRFRHLIEHGDGRDDWLKWLREVVELRGDRGGPDAPPSSPG